MSKKEKRHNICEKEQEAVRKAVHENVEKLETMDKLTDAQAAAIKKHLPMLMNICSEIRSADGSDEMDEIRTAIKVHMLALEKVLGRAQGMTEIGMLIDNEKDVAKLEGNLYEYIRSYLRFMDVYRESKQKKINFAVKHLNDMKQQDKAEQRYWDELSKVVQLPFRKLKLDLDGDMKRPGPVKPDAPHEKPEKPEEKAKEKKQQDVPDKQAMQPLPEAERYQGYRYLPPELQEKLDSTDIEVLKGINTTAHPMLKDYIDHRIAALSKKKEEQDEKKKKQEPKKEIKPLVKEHKMERHL